VPSLIYVAVPAGAVAFGLAWMLLIEPKRFRLRRIAISPPGSCRQGLSSSLAHRLPPLTILHITDTHFGSHDGGKMEFLRRACRESYELAFLTGDLIDRPRGLAQAFELAELLRPRLGSYAVLGGHDHYFGVLGRHRYLAAGSSEPPPRRLLRDNPVRQLVEGLTRRGVEVLQDESRLLKGPDGEEFAIVGLRDAFMFRPDYDAAWDGVPQATPTIVLAHSPDALPEVSRRGADLAFFGHTHGGQVRLPLVGALVTRSRLEAQRAAGVFREGDTIFTINHGVGAGRGINFRLLCRPEVTLVTLWDGRAETGKR